MKASSDIQAASPAPASTTELIAINWHKERPDLELDNLVVTLYLMQLGTLVERTFGSLCEERWSISGSDMRVLFALRRDGKPYCKRPTDLFRTLVVTSGAVTKKVDRLEAKGLVQRLPDPTHGGGFLVQLTRKGMKVTDEAVEEVCAKPLLTGIVGLSKEQLEAGKAFASRVLVSTELAATNAEQDAADGKRALRKRTPRQDTKKAATGKAAAQRRTPR